MTEEDELRACPLFSSGWDLLPLNLVFVEVGYGIDYNPGNAAAKIDGFVHDETEDSGREDIVLHVGIPTGPQSLKDVQVNIILGQLVIDTYVGVGGC